MDHVPYLRTGILFGLMTLLSAQAAQNLNVLDYGAKGDGIALDSPAINEAIEAASTAGGGIVRLPPGKYFCGSIHMKSHVNLHLEEGAVIIADKWNSKNYDPTEPFDPPAYQDGGHTYFRNSLIWGEHLTNVAITGKGMIDGSGLTTWQGELNKKIGFGKGSEGMEAQKAIDPDKPTYAANKAIALKSCNGVEIRDITILRGGWFAIIVTGCDNVALDNLTIDTNRDGIDIDGCENVKVTNCRVNAPNDDAICPKSTHILGYPRPTKNLLIKDCYVSGFKVGTYLDGTRQPDETDHRNARIKFGTESSGGFINCEVRDCVFESSMGFALEVVDGGLIENIVVDNLKMTDVKNYVLYIVTGKRNRTPDLKTISTMRNVRISNISAEGVDTMSGMQIFGMKDQPIENLHIENVRIVSKGSGTPKDAAFVPKELGTQYPDPSGKGTMPAYGIFARHVKDLKLSNIDLSFIAPDARPAAEFVNIDGLRIHRLRAQTGDGIPVAKFAPDVSRLEVSESPGLPASRP